MRKTWLIVATTYRRRVRSGMFLILTFGLPVIMVIGGAVPLLRSRSNELVNVGYVDETGRLPLIPQPASDDTPVHVAAYANSDAAQAAFRQGTITGYLVIPRGYFEGESATFYGKAEPGEKPRDALEEAVRRARLRDKPDWLLDRLAEPSEITYIVREGGLEIAEGPALIVRLAFPAILALLFAFAVLTGVSQIGSAIVLEKDQRALEIIITSLTPKELVAGKVLGMTLLSLTQIAIWALGGSIAIALALLRSGELQNLTLPWGVLVWAVALGTPGYFLYAVLAAGLGIIADDSQQAQQLAGALAFLGVVPLWFLGQLIDTPDGPLAIALTLFPLSGPMVGLIRMVVTEVPTWQLLASLILILASLAGSIWLVARIFRTAMLMYGQLLRPRQLWRALHSS